MSMIMIICGGIIILLIIIIGITSVKQAIMEKLKGNRTTCGCLTLAAMIISLLAIPEKTPETIAILAILVAIGLLILVFKMLETLRLSLAMWQRQRRKIRAMGAQEQNQLRKVSLYKSQAINKRTGTLVIAGLLLLIGIVLSIVIAVQHVLMSTQRPTATATIAPGVTMYVSANEGANVRDCPRTTCGIIGGLSLGANIQALEWVEGEEVNENNEWIEFRHDGELAYVHGGLVSTKRPNQ